VSAENVAVATRLYEAVARGDVDLVWELVDPDLEWETSPNLPDGGVYRGRGRVRAFLEEEGEILWGGAPTFDIERVFDCGDDVLMFIRVRGRGSRTGIALDVSIAHLVTVRSGRPVRVKVFPDRRKALEAVGLTE
jgi:uncharacterized protein